MSSYINLPSANRMMRYNPRKNVTHVPQAGVSPKLIKQHANYLISTDDIYTSS